MSEMTPSLRASCFDRGVETEMRPDVDLGGELCPECEPLDVKLLGKPETRLERYSRIYGAGEQS